MSKKTISDLEGWPISVWTSSGTVAVPWDLFAAMVQSVQARDKCIRVTVSDDHGLYSSVLSTPTRGEASAAAVAIETQLPLGLEELGSVEFDAGYQAED